MAKFSKEEINLVLTSSIEKDIEDYEDKVKEAQSQYKANIEELQKQQANLLESATDRKTLKEAEKKLREINAELVTVNIDAAIEQKKKEIALDIDYEAKKHHEEELRELEKQKKKAEEEKEREKKAQERTENNKKALADAVNNIISGGIDKLRNGISQAAETYAGYVDRIQVRLLGANESVKSITDKLSGVFGASPIFRMTSVMDKVAEVVEKGITFNVESRAAMAVLKDKIAATFDAFDSSLLRLIKIQQEDSTQARLGMESLLTDYFNTQFQDSSYLYGQSAQVRSALLEAESRLSTEDATRFEYVVQKWLGSMSSVGVSDTLIQKLAQGIGYLGSGNVSALTGDTTLETLLATLSSRSNVSYGQMLTNGVQLSDITSLMTGLYSLAKEISDTDNAVKLSEYARIFGMSVSDIVSIMNLSSEDMQAIANDLDVTYEGLIQRVSDESTFEKLLSRTSVASIGENLWQNFLYGAGQEVGSNLGSYISWKVLDILAGTFEGVETGVDIQPFGVGTHMNLSVGDIFKVAQVMAGAGAGLWNFLGNIGSIGGVNLSALGDNEASHHIQQGTVNAMKEGGANLSALEYSSNYDESSLGDIADNLTKQQTASVKEDNNYDEEKQKTESIANSSKEIADDIKIIVKLLNDVGIVIRGSAYYTTPYDFSSGLMQDDTTGKSLIGVR